MSAGLTAPSPLASPAEPVAASVPARREFKRPLSWAQAEERSASVAARRGRAQRTRVAARKRRITTLFLLVSQIVLLTVYCDSSLFLQQDQVGPDLDFCGLPETFVEVHVNAA